MGRRELGQRQVGVGKGGECEEEAKGGRALEEEIGEGSERVV